MSLGVTGALALAGSRTHPATLPEAAAAQGRPNVLVIESDDQTVESMRVMDNVDSLIGDRGAKFRNSFVNYSLCCPSRASFLTGQYEHNHGVLSNKAPDGGFDRFEALHADNNLAVWLHHAGYHTGLIGKYLNGYSKDSPVQPGWSEWQVPVQGSSFVYNYTLNVNGTLVEYGDAPADFLQDVLTRRAVNYVDRRAPRAQPFFLWLTYTSPHWSGPNPNPNPPYNNCHFAAKPAPRHAHAFDSEPLPKPPGFNEADVSDKPAEIRNRPLLNGNQITDIQRMYRCELESLLSVDEGVRKIVNELKAQGELDNTLLAYTSDNGFFHGQHRIPRDKMHIYEPSIRVPLQIRGPGIPRGEKVSDLSINADLAPTILDVANADPGLLMDGRSLIPVAQQPGIEQGRELLIEEPSFSAIRTERYMYAEHDTGETELYDLREDPFERRSRHDAPAYAAVKARLATDLHQLQNCAGPACRLHSGP